MYTQPAKNEGKFDNEELRVDRSDGNAYSKADFIQVGVTRKGSQFTMLIESEFVICIGVLSHRRMVERRNGMLRKC